MKHMLIREHRMQHILWVSICVQWNSRTIISQVPGTAIETTVITDRTTLHLIEEKESDSHSCPIHLGIWVNILRRSVKNMGFKCTLKEIRPSKAYWWLPRKKVLSPEKWGHIEVEVCKGRLWCLYCAQSSND